VRVGKKEMLQWRMSDPTPKMVAVSAQSDKQRMQSQLQQSGVTESWCRVSACRAEICAQKQGTERDVPRVTTTAERRVGRLERRGNGSVQKKNN